MVYNIYTFEQLQESTKEGLVLVDFYTDTCGACHLNLPILNEIAEQFAGKINIFKVQADACQDVANACNIQTVPSMALFKNGKMIKEIRGFQPKEILEIYLESFMD